jgi:hypothetical protein
MATPKQQRRRALELLEASIDGCTEAIMLAYGFKTELLVELVNAGLATASIERIVAGGRRVEVTRVRITGAGRGTRKASMALILNRASVSRVSDEWSEDAPRPDTPPTRPALHSARDNHRGG